MKKIILITALFLSTIAVSTLLRAETCESCQKAFTTHEDVTAENCKCSQPCDCYDKNCPCLWYGCCAELITNENLAQQEQQTKQIPSIVKQEVQIAEKPKEALGSNKTIEKSSTVKPIKQAIQPAKAFKHEKVKKVKPIKERSTKKERTRKVHQLNRKETSCAYCEGKANIKKCTCNSHCHCIKKNCKCIQEGCQCGQKAIKVETKEITLKVNEPYTIELANEFAPEKEWVVGNKKLPKWFTATRITDKGNVTTYEFKATQRGRVILALHLIGKGEKKAVQKMRYKIKIEKSDKEAAANETK